MNASGNSSQVGEFSAQRRTTQVPTAGRLAIHLAVLLAMFLVAGVRARAGDQEFEISFPASAHGASITGRVFVALT
jgi:hypothetical protein